jgi:transposase-like protein
METKKFREPAILQQMLQDYATSGLSCAALARNYGCDHTSIVFQVKKHKVQRGMALQKPMPPPKIEPPAPEVHKHDHIFNEPINRGKASYTEYLAE